MGAPVISVLIVIAAVGLSGGVLAWRHLARLHDDMTQFHAVMERQDASLRQQARLLRSLLDSGQDDDIHEYRLLRTLIDALPDLIYVKDTQHRFLLANTALCEYLNHTAEELAGKSDHDLLEPELADRYYEDERRVMDTGKPLLEREEPGLDRRTHATRWFLTTKVPFYDRHGVLQGILGIGRDITRRKEAEDALFDLNERLKNRLQRHV